MPKLILGTAEFGPTPYGHGIKEPVSLNDIRMIMNCAKRGGIEILEGAEAYKCDEVLQDLNFDLIYKVDHPYSLDRVLDRTGRTSLMGLLIHQHDIERKSQSVFPDRRVLYTGSSVYSHKQLLGTEQMIEVPLNMNSREFETSTAPCKLVRSVFGRGQLLQEGRTVKECLDYVKSIKNVHGVIVGVNSVKELEEILKAWNG